MGEGGRSMAGHTRGGWRASSWLSATVSGGPLLALIRVWGGVTMHVGRWADVPGG
jgi:hypothetical protein